MNDLDRLREEQNAKEHGMILTAIEKLELNLNKNFVRVETFKPVRLITYGALGAGGLWVLETVFSKTIAVAQAFF